MEIAVIDPGYDSYEYEKRLFEKNGFEFNIFQGQIHDRESKIAFARNAVGILLRWTEVDESFLSRMPNLKAIVRYGVGYDNINVSAAEHYGVRVANVQSYANNAVSDHALALLLSCSRLLPLGQRSLRSNFGKPPATDVVELADKTLGIIGLGRIGGTLCRKARPLFERILAVDPYIHAERFEQLGAIQSDFHTLLQESNAISLHCNLTAETRNLINGSAFALMAKRPILVNTSRGPVVEEGALLDALHQGTIHSVGMDVYSEEPPGETLKPLLSHPRVIATGHYAWYSIKSSEVLQKRAADNLLALLRGVDVEDELRELKLR
jgi:D-3-phosphoglycerate dehydrogenase